MQNHSKKIFIATIFLSFILSPIACISFQISVSTEQKECVGQFLAQSTPFHIKVQGKSSQFKLSLSTYDQNEKKMIDLIKNERPDQTKKIDSYASVSGQYAFCIQNNDEQNSQFNFTFYQGIELSDLAALPKMEDSKIIDQVVDKINEIYQVIKDQEVYSRTVNEYNMQLQKLVSFKSVGFGLLSIAVVLIISFLHYIQIKRVLKNRKVI